MRFPIVSLVSPMSASFFVQASNAAITTMIAIVIADRGGEQSDVALIAAFYSLGFLAGCFLSPPQVRRIGLIRAFAAATATLTIAIIALDLFDGVGLWAFLRFVMGASMAMALAVSDTWINNRAPNELRGRVIALYAIVVSLAVLTSQFVFLLFDASTEGFILIFAIAMNFAVVLVALTSTNAPDVDREPSRSFHLITGTSLTANVGAFSAGFMATSIISIVPFYQRTHGVQEEIVAMSIATLYLGRLLFQWPVGLISDRFDRRNVLAGLCVVIASLAVLGLLLGNYGEYEGRVISSAEGVSMQLLAFLITLLLGAMLYPIYSVASALAFDRAEGRSMINISTTLLAIYSIGSVAGPFTVMLLSGVAGDSALGICLLIMSVVVVSTAVLRKSIVDSPEKPIHGLGTVPDSSVEMVQVAAEQAEDTAAEGHKAAEVSEAK